MVGAHWDTVDGTGGLNDNGSGMPEYQSVIRAYACMRLYDAWFYGLSVQVWLPCWSWPGHSVMGSVATGGAQALHW